MKKERLSNETFNCLLSGYGSNFIPGRSDTSIAVNMEKTKIDLTIMPASSDMTQVTNDSGQSAMILSFIGQLSSNEPGKGAMLQLVMSPSKVRLIVRDM